MRALSYRQAAACESASTSRCRCRCGGAFHGANRGAPLDLPPDDPHRPERRYRQLALDLPPIELPAPADPAAYFAGVQQLGAELRALGVAATVRRRRASAGRRSASVTVARRSGERLSDA
jgi:hypothetical protein